MKQWLSDFVSDFGSAFKSLPDRFRSICRMLILGGLLAA